MTGTTGPGHFRYTVRFVHPPQMDDGAIVIALVNGSWIPRLVQA